MQLGILKKRHGKLSNDLTDGGLGKGELAVFVAPAGIGKVMGIN
jgi:hypothetical protein